MLQLTYCEITIIANYLIFSHSCEFQYCLFEMSLETEINLRFKRRQNLPCLIFQCFLLFLREQTELVYPFFAFFVIAYQVHCIIGRVLKYTNRKCNSSYLRWLYYLEENLGLIKNVKNYF